MKIWIFWISLYAGLISNVHASVYERNALSFYQDKLTFSSVIFIKKHMAKGRPLSGQLEEIILNVLIDYGSSSFADLNEKILGRYLESPVINFILASKLFKEQRFEEVLEVMNRIPDTHPLAVEKTFILGALKGLIGKYTQAYGNYKKCRKYAEEKKESVEEVIWKRYYAVIGENCKIHEARLLYEQGKYKDALVAYRAIPKTSYRWPYILLEKAWNNFRIKNYNRALGLAATYKSPLLEDYFSPESDYLRGLSYMRLCYWKDAGGVVDEYQKKYKRNAKLLARLLKKFENSSKFFIGAYLKITKKGRRARTNRSSFIEGLMFRAKKKIKFNLDLRAYYGLRQELKNVSKVSRGKNVTKFVRYHLKKMISAKISMLNDSIKREMFTFLNDVYKFSREITKIHLDLLARERRALYASSKKKKKRRVLRTVGSLDNVKRGRLQHFYSFTGEFWADELGEYSFGLKSKCVAKSRRGKR